MSGEEHTAQWRDLLRKYIDHVGIQEGFTFLSEQYKEHFTPEEWKMLQEVSGEE